MKKKILALAFAITCAIPLNAQSVTKSLNDIKIIGLNLIPFKGHDLIFWEQKVSRIVLYGTAAKVIDFLLENGNFNLPCKCDRANQAQVLDSLRAWGYVMSEVNQNVVNKEIVQVVLCDPDDYGHVFKSYEKGVSQGGGVLKCRTDVAFKFCSEDKKACYEIKCDKYIVEICYATSGRAMR